MSACGLGIELDVAVVRWATAANVTAIDSSGEVAPSAVVVDGRIVAGSAAADASATAPANVLHDLIGQFVVDRLWFVGGLMITPDEAMRELLSGCVGDARRAADGSVAAVTVSCPGGWDESAVARVRDLLDVLALPLPNVRVAVGVAAAAADAASRIPERPVIDVSGDLPPLSSRPSTRRPMPESVPAAPEPHRRAQRRRWGWAAWLVVVLGVPAIVYVVLRASSEPEASPPETTPSVASRPVSTSPAVATTTPIGALTIGFVSAGDAGAEESFRAALAALGAQSDVFVSGVFPVVQPVGDPAAVVEQMLSQGVTAVITDAPGEQIEGVVSAARDAGLPLCIAGESALDTVRGPGVAVADVGTCASFLGLAAVSAGSVAPRLIVSEMDSLVGGSGLTCADFAQCAAYLSASQPISFEPDAGTIVLAPDM